MRKLRKSTRTAALTALALVAGVAVSHAAGFSLIEQSASGLGSAYAGAAATAEDASTLYFNPAGMVRLKGQNIAAAGHLVSPTIQLKNTGTTSAIPGQETTGGNGGEAGVTKVIPNFYYVYGMGDTAVGLGVSVPFGLATSYNSDWAGRYYATESSLKTININPAFAYKIDKKISVGAGLSAQYLKANLANKINFGAGVNPAFSQAFDGDVDLTADGWAYGFNAGALVDVTDTTRVGLNYRSKYKYNLKGNADFTLPTFTSPPLPNQPTADGVNAALAANYKDTDAKTDITMPAIASLSLYQQVTPAWALLADATWTQWSCLDKLVVEFDSGLADSTTPYHWKDAWRLSLGTEYQALDSLLLRAGAAYDQSPVPSAKYRTPRVPDNDRYWLSLGGTYKAANWLKVDAGYTHIIVEPSQIHNDTNPTAGVMNADVKSFVDIVSLQLSMNF